MSKKTYTAICFFPIAQNKRPHKYRNVSTPARLTLYMKRKGANYINFYDTVTKNYEFRIYTNARDLDEQNTIIKDQQAIKEVTNAFTQFINNLKM